MRVKIFEAGFGEKEFEDFIKKSKVQEIKFNIDGAGRCIIFYKKIDEVGDEPISVLEKIDQLIRKNEDQILTHENEIVQSNMKLADVKEEISKTSPNETKKWDDLQKQRLEHERQLLMSDFTIKENKRYILVLTEKHDEVRKKIK